MQIIKFGHSCFLVKTNDQNLLFDPGVFTDKSVLSSKIDLVLITHGHSDHLDLDLLKEILQNNSAQILTNSEVADKLAEQNIASVVMKSGEIRQFGKVKIEVFGAEHIAVYPGIDFGANIGFLINDAFFNPGDAYLIPNRKIDILALPVAGPWVKLEDAINYALKLKPRVCFPIHDGMLKNPGVINVLPPKILAKHDISFIELELNKEYEL